MQKDLLIDKKRSIGMAAKELDLPTHVIRFWETQFNQIKPEIGKGARRYYLNKDIELLKKIKFFLYDKGYTIKGLQNLFTCNKDVLKQTLEEITNSKYSVEGDIITQTNIITPNVEELIKLSAKARNIVVKIDQLITNN